MNDDIKKYCESCESCAIHKLGRTTKAPLQIYETPEEIFQRVSMDIVGPLNMTEQGNRYILTFMDYLTRYVECIPLNNITAATIAKAFITKIITRHGAPKVLLTDCGS